MTEPTPLDQPPDWVADAIFYQIFPDRFARSDEVHKPNGLEDWDSAFASGKVFSAYIVPDASVTSRTEFR